jgi:hypothetical protein
MTERCGDRQRKVRWAEEVAVTLLHRESPGDAPGGASPARLRSLSIHVVDQLLGCVHPHRSHWSWRHIFHRNRDRWGVIVRVSIPNTGIHRSSWCPKRIRRGVKRALSRIRQLRNGGSGRSSVVHLYRHHIRANAPVYRDSGTQTMAEARGP